MKAKTNQSVTVLLPLALLLAWQALGATVTVDFEDGAARGGEAIATSYAHLGLTFSNARWITPDYIGSRYDPSDWFLGSAGLGAQSGELADSSWAFPGLQHPISVSFAVPAEWVSITAFNVGANGVRAQAFDADGTLIGSVATDGTGFGVGNNPVLYLSNTAGPISRVALDQYNWTGLNDGVSFDTLSFSIIPEPSTLTLSLLVGVALATSYRCKKRASE